MTTKREIDMFNADVAAMLLNRLTVAEEIGDAHLALLHEGNIAFTTVNGCIETEDAEAMGTWRAETLCFDDGSRVLRVGSPIPAPVWTQWMVLCPAAVNANNEATAIA